MRVGMRGRLKLCEEQLQGRVLGGHLGESHLLGMMGWERRNSEFQERAIEGATELEVGDGEGHVGKDRLVPHRLINYLNSRLLYKLLPAPPLHIILSPIKNDTLFAFAVLLICPYVCNCYFFGNQQQSIMQLSQVVALFAGFMVMLVNGSLYVYGTMTPYIITYLHYKGDTSLTISDLSIILTMAVIFTNFGMFCSNFPQITYSNRTTSFIAVLGIALAMLALSFSTHFALYVIIYGVFYGFFIGYGYMAPLKNCYDHLPDRKGLCSGTCLMGFGLGAFFFNFILVAIVNPDNEKQGSDHLFSEEIGNRLPLSFQILGLIYAAIGIVGAVLTIPVKKEGEQVALITEQAKDQLEGHGHYSGFAFQLANQKKIISLAVILSATVPFGLFVAFNYKQYGLYYINDDHYLSVLGSIGSVGNGVFRMVWGILLDMMPFKTIKYIMIGIFVVSCATIKWSVLNDASYLITVLLTYGCYGGLYSIYPTQTVRMLGRQLGPKLYYITFFGFSFGAILQYLAHKFLVEQFKLQGYNYCFIIFGIFLLASVLLTFFTDLQPKQASVAKHSIETDQ